ncbi:SpoIID/LytB domain-containing protein [Alkalicella caledoniensis]|uniref:SpoIID/LytB domain-containing protein n=1 Tax=Alkalicella caledoniensis TaxID=2731377 RepID=A0A7G9WCZ3_ALKCA|nr:SpoIID/LytB domain-containing protein [Alkalicella caledoniensis]QNO16555.1 SpoIID/LytB domain-containing protein [Alkalicella caledoniensis]
MKRLIKVKVVFLIVVLSCIFLTPNFQVAANANYSTIRVLLSISKASIPVVLDGEYMIQQDPELILPKGTYTISVASNNRVRINGNGINKIIGSTLTLVRLKNEGNGNNHLTIRGTDYGDINYLGNMVFTVNGSNLRVVNHVPLEEYLYGVVPYEMSNSFPLEALKAQAVSARGYAIRYIKTSGTHDLGDTTTHQVYKGYNPSYARAIRAVDETAGRVLTHNGTIIATYYSASNGGQTELAGNVWVTNLPYLVQKDDPYDLENTASIYHKFFVPKVVEGSAYDSATLPGEHAVRIVKTNSNINVRSGPGTNHSILGTTTLNNVYEWVSTASNGWHQIKYNGQDAYITPDYAARVESGTFLYASPVLADLQIKAFEKLKADGHDIEKATDVKITNVNSLANGQKRWPNTQSRTFLTANGNITVQYYLTGSDTLSSKSNIDVTINLMNRNASGSILNTHEYFSTNTRMRGVTPESNGFTVTAGRYGHGVGMSQRGAQQMASSPHNKKYNEILAFYFHGTSLLTVDTKVPDLPIRPDPQPEPPTEPDTPKEPNVSSSKHKINDNNVTGVSTGMKASTFISNISVNDGTVELLNSSGQNKKSDDKVVTGDILRVKQTDNKTFKEYPIIIYGDVTGSGEIALIDLLTIQRHLLNISKLNGPYQTAADVSKDGSLTLLDLLMVQRHLLKIENIKQ